MFLDWDFHQSVSARSWKSLKSLLIFPKMSLAHCWNYMLSLRTSLLWTFYLLLDVVHQSGNKGSGWRQGRASSQDNCPELWRGGFSFPPVPSFQRGRWEGTEFMRLTFPCRYSSWRTPLDLAKKKLDFWERDGYFGETQELLSERSSHHKEIDWLMSKRNTGRATSQWLLLPPLTFLSDPLVYKVLCHGRYLIWPFHQSHGILFLCFISFRGQHILTLWRSWSWQCRAMF